MFHTPVTYRQSDFVSGISTLTVVIAASSVVSLLMSEVEQLLVPHETLQTQRTYLVDKRT